MINEARGPGIVVGLWLVVSIAACSNSPQGRALGEDCTGNLPCASGMCVEVTGGTAQFCSAACTSNADCATPITRAQLVCDVGAGHCVEHCGYGQTAGTGASLQICDYDSGLLVACSSVDAASHCTDCGCEPYGGGVCVSGTGCVIPMPDGMPCTIDATCSSGVCYRDTHTCGAPRAMGDPCLDDAECASSNCSTDGSGTTPGHCNAELGSVCAAPSVGHNRTATCNDCYVLLGDTAGHCQRTDCDPTRADHCATFGGHEFRCAHAVDGAYYCFEWCPDDLHDCFYDTVSCFRANDYCR